MRVFVLHEPDDMIRIYNTRELAQKIADKEYPEYADPDIPKYQKSYYIEQYEILED